jgi:hypothetical protein
MYSVIIFVSDAGWRCPLESLSKRIFPVRASMVMRREFTARFSNIRKKAQAMARNE